MHPVTALESGLNYCGLEFSARTRERKEFAAAGKKFRRTALVGVDVRDLVAKHTLMPRAERGERKGVGGGAIEHEERFAIGLEDIAHELLRAGGGRVCAVARDAAGIRGVERGERLGTNPRGVVARERVVVAGWTWRNFHGESAGRKRFQPWDGAGGGPVFRDLATARAMRFVRLHTR